MATVSSSSFEVQDQDVARQAGRKQASLRQAPEHLNATAPTLPRSRRARGRRLALRPASPPRDPAPCSDGSEDNQAGDPYLQVREPSQNTAGARGRCRPQRERKHATCAAGHRTGRQRHCRHAGGPGAGLSRRTGDAIRATAAQAQCYCAVAPAMNCSSSASAAPRALSGAVIVSRIASTSSRSSKQRNEQHACSLRTNSLTRARARGA